MTDGDALLRAILQAPDDDAPRLVYADWLDEHGEPERAEFIRIQVTLAKYPPGCCPPMTNADPNCKCPFCALRRRERELKDWMPDHWGHSEDNQRAWGVLGFWGCGTWNWDWRRGFIGLFTCTAADWLAHADAITAAHPVREVRLTTPLPRLIMDFRRGITWTPKGDGTWTADRWQGITFHRPETQREWVVVNSANIDRMSWQNGSLIVLYLNGEMFEYRGVSADDWRDIRHSPSPARVIHRIFRPVTAIGH